MSEPYLPLTLSVNTDTVLPMKRPYIQPKRGPGKPPRPMPALIDASPEAVARMLVTTPPKKDEDWRYPEKSKKGLL